MAHHRSDHIASMILREVSTIIQFDLHHPDIGFVTVTSVKLTPDLGYAKIYFAIHEADTQKTFKALEKSKAFIRRELAQRIDIYKVPELAFFVDETYAEGQRIDAILKGIKTK